MHLLLIKSNTMNIKKIISAVLLLVLAISCSAKQKPYFNRSWGYLDAKKMSEKKDITTVGKIDNKAIPLKQKKVVKKTKPAVVKAAQKNSKVKNLNKKPVVKNVQPKSVNQIIIAARNSGSTSYKIAGKICEHLNSDKNFKPRCVVEPVKNIMQALKNQSRYDFIVSKNSIEQEFKLLNNGDHGLKSMFSLYPELSTMIVGKKSGIKTMKDLAGKTVFLASSGPVAKKEFDRVLEASGVKLDSIKIVKGLRMGNAFCDGKIDAIFTEINHPDADIDEFIDVCGAKILTPSKDVVDSLAKKYPEYTIGAIPAGEYSNHSVVIRNIAITANLIATSKVSNDVIYNVAKSVFGDLQGFKTRDRSLLDLVAKNMIEVNNGLIFDIHPDAVRYYKEIGLIK